MKSQDGQEYCMDRIMRVTVKGPSGTRVMEYCPNADKKLCVKMEATLKYLPMSQPKNNRPGFSAVVKIYNPPADLITIIDKHANWPIGYAGQGAAAKYYRGRCSVLVEAGYWNYDAKDGRDYKRLFEGKLNTSAYYRKGVDDILELYYHNIELTDDEVGSMTTVAKVASSNYQSTLYEDSKASNPEGKIYGSADKSWHGLMWELISRHNNEIVDTDNIITKLQAIRDGTLGNPEFLIHYIMAPSDPLNPEDGAQRDMSLEKETANVNTKRLVLNGITFRDQIQEMCDFFPKGLRYSIKAKGNTGHYYFWRVGVGKAANNNWQTTDKLVIYNYQNLLEAPSVDGTGCLTVKMMFNPNAIAGHGIELRWVDGLKIGSAISDYTQGAASTAQLKNYYPSLQAGRYSVQVKALQYARDQQGKGDIFNIPFKIGYVTHTLSTHGAAWHTQVKTLPFLAQILKS